MTAAERLKQLSGLAGASAAVMLLAIGAGATAGEILSSQSGLASATAAEHLLAEREEPKQEESNAGSKRRKHSHGDDDWPVDLVLDKWEAIARASSQDPPAQTNAGSKKVSSQPTVEASDQAATIANAAVPRLSLPKTVAMSLDSSALQRSPDAALAAVEARRKNDEAALLLLLMEL